MVGEGPLSGTPAGSKVPPPASPPPPPETARRPDKTPRTLLHYEAMIGGALAPIEIHKCGERAKELHSYRALPVAFSMLGRVPSL